MEVCATMFMFRCRRVAAALLLGVLACGGGMHFAALQTVAWAGMVWTYSATTGSLVEGTRKAFDGEHPCTLCTRIKEVSAQTQQSPVKIFETAKKIDLMVLPRGSDMRPRRGGDFSYPRPRDAWASARAEAPPQPVPIVG